MLNLILLTLGPFKRYQLENKISENFNIYQLNFALFLQFTSFNFTATSSIVLKLYRPSHSRSNCVAQLPVLLYTILIVLFNLVTTTTGKIFEKNSSFHVKQGTTGKVQFLFSRSLLLVLTKFSFWEETGHQLIIP